LDPRLGEGWVSAQDTGTDITIGATSQAVTVTADSDEYRRLSRRTITAAGHIRVTGRARRAGHLHSRPGVDL
jgi:hypothetical protein